MRIIAIFILFSISFTVNGQKTFQPKALNVDWKGIVYRKETAFEARVHTNGILLGMNFGKIKTYYRTNYYHLSLGILKDPREKRQNRNLAFTFPSTSRSFALGKQNSVFNIRAGVGMRRFLSEKANRKGIAIGYDLQIGPSIALLKPYYLELIYPGEGGGSPSVEIRTEKYSEANAEKWTELTSIYGGAGYFKGFNEISLVPGVQAKAGLFFSMGAFEKSVKAIETGIMVDVYGNSLPIMVETDAVSNKPYFVNLYLNLWLGSRKN